MLKKIYNKIMNRKFKTLVFLFLSVSCSASSIPQPRYHPSTLQWMQRADVKNALKQLQEAHVALEMYVQKIYNAYVSHTIGDDKLMRDRMKDIARLITAAENVEGIYSIYKGSIETSNPLAKSIVLMKKAIPLYYFDHTLKVLLNHDRTIIRELESSLDSLSSPKWNPDFVRVTKFNKNEATQLLIKIEQAIHAAVATIPGGADILEFR